MEDIATTPTTGRLLASRRQLRRSSSQSPSRPRLGDELLVRLTPRSAVEALRDPIGPLKICLEEAPPSEQSFALRTAVASNRISEWLDELSAWPWPSEGGAAGFEMPPAKKRKLSKAKVATNRSRNDVHESASHKEEEYMGSLLASDVARYERRLDKIQSEMDELDVEEIKSHVLHNHIMPLSRPGTPFSEAGRPGGSSILFAKMEDLTAVITAITVQALPNLSKLSRLLNTWSSRLAILRRVPALLDMILDAEVALQSGWDAVKLGADDSGIESPGSNTSFHESKALSLTRKDFGIMNSVLQAKMAKPGRDIDFMLDALESQEDTLPNKWLDRMEAIERSYIDWVTFGERQVRQGEWLKLHKVNMPRLPAPAPSTPTIEISDSSPTRDIYETDESETPSSPPGTMNQSAESETEDSLPVIEIPGARGSAPSSVPVKVLINGPGAHLTDIEPEVMDMTNVAKQQNLEDAWTNESRVVSNGEEQHISITASGRNQSFDGSDDLESSNFHESVLSEVNKNIIRGPMKASKQGDGSRFDDDDLLFSDQNKDEPEPSLPPLKPASRRGSDASNTSTIVHGPTSHYPFFSDSVSQREESIEPELPRLPDPDEPLSSDAPSPPSSPPLRAKARAASVTFNELPNVVPTPNDEDTPPRSPLETSEMFDPDVSEYESQIGSPSRLSEISTDDHLQQQISDILQSIPAKIRLGRSVDLNPPDLHLPKMNSKSRATPEPFRRSGSSLSTRTTTSRASSRAGTPHFTLAPARQPRHRPRGNQEIKLYHLSRPNGEAPIKLFIRCVGEKGERVMVRVGGGWADLGEYLKEYASHHGRRGEGKVEVREGLPRITTSRGTGSSPPSRPASALEAPVMTPLAVRKTRKSMGEEGSSRMIPRTPQAISRQASENTPSSEISTRSRASSRLSWTEEESSLGLAGPKAKKVDMDDESRAWVESVKEKVRIASGERKQSSSSEYQNHTMDGKFGELSKVGGTKRLFRKGQ